LLDEEAENQDARDKNVMLDDWSCKIGLG
jgi:hypothetical protein